ncbi:hypothetical protein BJI69_04785 [Luteibacter rhizovicinus DSM 16549]|uniref:Uncharacterized protein n=2 Tax=Luteibacter rhizovicinus TaxID=242606 RepID=A0A1L3EQE9_9GAMM|nr:hypothetical protein BJI69_04785 [Luteibacter rhizovicinus DSM 16549]
MFRALSDTTPLHVRSHAPDTCHIAFPSLPSLTAMMRECPGSNAMRMSKAAWFCLLANTVGLGFYLHFISKLWAGMPGDVLYANDGPGAISWGLTAFPFEAACTIINLILLVGAVRRVILDRGWSLMVTWAIVLGAWMVMDLYFASHFV